MAEEARPVYLIGCGADEGPPGPVAELGFKAHNLARLTRIGIPVPPAFVLGTSWCRACLAQGGQLPEGARGQLAAALRRLEAASGLAFGSSRRPLLVSVRSGAPVSMPGMMDTVLNVGLGDGTLSGLLRLSGNPRLVWDSYRRLIESFAETVAGLPGAPFETARREALSAAAVTAPAQLDFRALRALAQRALELYAAAADQPFPQSPVEQLEQAVAAVFRSWAGARARWYREAHGIGHELGTAVTVQRMVFGNAGGTSGAGAGFTRNPATGSAELYLDFAPNAQGEDVVSGRTGLAGGAALQNLPVSIGEELAELASLLEHEFRDAQEFEFTVENGELFVLQTREAKRTPLAALRIAVELAEAGLLTPAEARSRIAMLDPGALEIVELAAAGSVEPLLTGVGASIGVAAGAAVFDPDRAIDRARAGEVVILVREELATSDIAALEATAGLLAVRGARTSHAAVVARQLGKACIVGCAGLAIDADRHAGQVGARRIAEGEMLTLDAASGRVYPGRLAVVRRPPSELLGRLNALGA
ncbi:MAG TPA: PEP/pyruvate-binding domain-containing protein [Steroidobacteraceae bacterium]|nr:PEP/pyruvate-binding domain-containing protein [Steroidobacteraceae bacterium]